MLALVQLLIGCCRIGLAQDGWGTTHNGEDRSETVLPARLSSPTSGLRNWIGNHSVWGWTAGGEDDESASMGGTARSGAVLAGRFAAVVRSGRRTGARGNLRVRKRKPQEASRPRFHGGPASPRASRQGGGGVPLYASERERFLG